MQLPDNISLAAIQHIKELNALVNSAYRGETSKQGWTTEADLLDGIRTDEEGLKETIKRDNSWILIHTDIENKIVACVHLEKHNRKLYLGMLTVAPHLQGKGTGKFLLNVAEDVAKSLQCIAIYMTVITDRTELIAWYEKHGYVNTHELKPFPDNDPRFGLPKKKLMFTVLEKAILT
jgi:N-acetylglutamate synthase-like GNAT family acetyltransferase